MSLMPHDMAQGSRASCYGARILCFKLLILADYQRELPVSKLATMASDCDRKV